MSANPDQPPPHRPAPQDPSPPPLDYRTAEPHRINVGDILVRVGATIVGFAAGAVAILTLGAAVLRNYGTPPPPDAGPLASNTLTGPAYRWGIAGCAAVALAALGILVYLFVNRRQSRFVLMGLLLGIGLASLLTGLCFGGG